MKSRNTIVLSGIIAVFLAMSLSTVMASSFPQEAAPGNIAPRIYMIDSSYDICYNEHDNSGSRPDGFDLQDDGCLDLVDEWRFEEYAFTGEQLIWKVAVRDLNGAEDISYVKFTVAGLTEALCVEEDHKGDAPGGWSEQIPAWGMAPAGFDCDTDKVFKCKLTVEPQWHGMKSVNIEAYDQAGAVSTMSIAQSWFFNPAIMLTLATNDGAPKVTYEEGYPGQTVMSTNKLVVTNLAEGGVDLWAFIAADDLTDPTSSGALCPYSNVLDVDADDNTADSGHQMDYRCKIGTCEEDHWLPMKNKDNTDGCDPESCFNARPLLEHCDEGAEYSIIGNGKSAECQFKLTYPVPCIGSFTQGNIHIIVKSV